jgi:hypothetical protein
MRKANSGQNRWTPLFPEKVVLIRTGQVCENRGYYGNLFTLKLPNGNLAEFHRRELRMELPLQTKAPGSHAMK